MHLFSGNFNATLDIPVLSPSRDLSHASVEAGDSRHNPVGYPPRASAEGSRTNSRLLTCSSCLCGISVTQARAESDVARARHHGMSMNELQTRSSSFRFQTAPHPESDTDSTCTAARGCGRVLGAGRGAIHRPTLHTADSQDRMERTAQPHDLSSDVDPGHETDDDESGLVMMPGHVGINPIEECRNRSHSAWLHFPHVELVFLFFAFEGAIASQVSAIHTAGCPEIIASAGVALVSVQYRGVLRLKSSGDVRSAPYPRMSTFSPGI